MSAARGLQSGNCGLTDKSTAGQWRLPTKDELLRRQQNQSGFSNVRAGYYWSDGANAFNPGYAYVVYMSDGGVAYGLKSGSFYVWPVRSGQ